MESAALSATPVSAPRRLGRRPVLDGMRGLAVLLVILTHTGILVNGYIGVDVFFAISGFLITVLLYEEWERSGRISLRGFYSRRARRLLPALLLLVGAIVVIALLSDPFADEWPLGWRLLTTLGFANNWVAASGYQHALGPLSPTWSLAQEEQFYILWPLVLWLMLRLRMRPAVMLALLGVMILGLLQAVPHVRHAIPYYSDYFSPLDRAAELLLGCVGAIVWRHRFVPRIVEWRPTSWLLLAGLIYLLFIDGIPRRWVYIGASLVGVLLIMSLLAEREPIISWILNSRPLRYIGTISYGLYLCHLLVHHLVVHYLPGRSPYFYTPIVIAMSIAIAGASWALIESRVIARGRARAAGAGGRRIRRWRGLTAPAIAR